MLNDKGARMLAYDRPLFTLLVIELDAEAWIGEKASDHLTYIQATSHVK